LDRPDGAKHLVVAEGLAKFTGTGWGAVPAALTDFVAWVLAGRVVPHAPRTKLHYPLRPLAVVWTAPRYIGAEDDHLAEAELQRRTHQARATAERSVAEQRRAEIRAKNAALRAKALQEATAAELAARGRPEQQPWLRERALRRPEVRRAIALLVEEYGATVAVGWSTGDPRYAGGAVLVDADGVPVAVFDPTPDKVRGDAFRLLIGLPLLFPTKHAALLFEFAMERTKRLPLGSFRTDFVDGRPCT
jgi:competence protein CoiA